MAVGTLGGPMLDAGVLEVVVRDARDLAVLAERLDEVLAAEVPFGLSLTGPADLDSWERLLWTAPAARAHLRRRRAAIGTWCAGAALVLDPDWLAAIVPAQLRRAQLIWGCTAVAVAGRDEAAAWLRDRLKVSHAA